MRRDGFFGRFVVFRYFIIFIGFRTLLNDDLSSLIGYGFSSAVIGDDRSGDW